MATFSRFTARCAPVAKPLAAISLAASLCFAAASDAPSPTNKVTDPATAQGPQTIDAGNAIRRNLVTEGRRLFLASCAHCHGADAHGDDGPDLHALEVSDRRIARVITGGIKGEMPSFAKKHGAEDIAALIAYLRTLE